VNIAHLLSQNHLTGAEVYAKQLALVQIHRQKHSVYQISNGFFAETPAEKIQLDVETKSKLQFFKNVFWLREFIAKNEIHVVHSHSRAAAKLAFYATAFTGTAHVSSVHGQQHSSFSKKLMNQYGEMIIAVCANVRTHLLRDFGYKSSRIKVIPNLISEEKFPYLLIQPQQRPIKIAIVGRATGPKGQRTEQVLKALYSDDFKNMSFSVDLIGAEMSQLKLSDDIKSRVHTFMTPEITAETYKDYDLVIGSGRVCMEALMTGRPTLAFGEACYVGLISPQNLEAATQSNFGDIHPDSNIPVLNEAQFKLDMMTAVQIHNGSFELELKKLSNMTRSIYGAEQVAPQVQRIYESAYFLKNHPCWFPVLMYHKIPENEIKSQHKIFVTKHNFRKHLEYFKRKGFTTLTFSELALYRKGEISFKSFPKKPLVLTFDDGYRDNLVNASPLLKEFGYKAQLFLLADKTINHNNWDKSSDEPAHEIIFGAERQSWKESAFEIGSHGFSHKKLTSFSETEALTELTESKKLLEEEFKQQINVFAFTYGITTENSRELARRGGYDYAVNTDTGGLLLEEDPYAIFRVNIFPNENSWSLFKKTSRWYRRYYYFKRKK
jgi:peptidoglycan/xylan/chitin deacetylase (PgdA/CDA1 family)